MSQKLFTEKHEWIQKDANDANVIKVGITDYAQDSLGDIVYVDLPSVDATFEQDADIAVVESTKAASDIYAPIAGTVLSVNEALADNPGLINSSPLDEGWLFTLRISNEDDLSSLLSEEAYQEFLKTI